MNAKTDIAGPSDLFTGQRIIVVEDEGITQLLLRNILHRAGFTLVGTAFSGEEVVALALQEPPDIVPTHHIDDVEVGRTGTIWRHYLPALRSMSSTGERMTDPKASPSQTQQTPSPYHKPHTVEELTDQNVQTIAKLEQSANQERSRSDVLADKIAGFCGNMMFVWIHIVWFGGWIGFNTFPHIKHIDPFPFQFLTLVVSLEAIFLTTFIMISQNRQGRIADRRNHLDLQINLLAEQENSKMLAMLDAMMKHMGVPDEDPDVQILEAATEPDKLMHQIQQIMEKTPKK